VSRAAGWASSAFGWYVATTPFRVWQRLSQVRGSILVSGIAYNSFFSLFPLLALVFTIFGLVLRTRLDIQDNLIVYLGNTFSGVFKSPETPDGLIDPLELVADITSNGSLTITGVVALVTLGWTGLGWVTSLRLGIRAAMHLSVHDFNPVIAKVRDFVIMIVLGGAVLVSAVVSVTIHTATEELLVGLGVGSSMEGRVLTRLLVAVPILALDFVIFSVQYRFLAASTLPARTLRWGALAAAVGFGALKLASGSALSGLLGGTSITVATFGVVIGLLVWFNVLARITLLGAAWAGLMAEESDPTYVNLRAEYDGNDPKSARRNGVAHPEEAVAGPAQATAAWSRAPGDWRAVLDDPSGPSVRAQDRAVLAAGVVLGATVVVGVRAAATAVGTVVRAAPRDDDESSRG